MLVIKKAADSKMLTAPLKNKKFVLVRRIMIRDDYRLH